MTNAQFPPQNVGVNLEVVPENEDQINIADINTVARELFDQLTDNGYTVKPTPSNKKGDDLLFDILLQIPQFLHENKDWLLGSIPPILECLLIARDKLAKQEKTARAPLKITFEVNGKSVAIETSDPKDITNLIEQLQTNPKLQTKTKIRVHVPAKKRRK